MILILTLSFPFAFDTRTLVSFGENLQDVKPQNKYLCYGVYHYLKGSDPGAAGHLFVIHLY